MAGVRVQDVTMRYPGAAAPALDGVSLDIAAMIPITLVFLALQRQFVSASLAGALKG